MTSIIRVLVIDDGPGAVRTVRDSLLRYGDFHVHGTRSIEEAGELLRTGAFDVALVDEGLWEDAGGLLVDATRNQTPGLAILLLSGDEPFQERRPAGVVGVLERSRLHDASYLRSEITEAHDEQRTLRRRDTMSRWLEREASSDRMTGLHNRKAFDEHLIARCLEAAAADQETAVIVANVTGTRTVNQAHGEEAGDAMIRRAAMGIARCVRASDFAARIGGDEFGIVVGSGDIDLARRIARRIAHQIDQMNDDEWANDIPVTMSFGVASGVTGDGASLLKAAQHQIRPEATRPTPFFARNWSDDDGPSVA